jgi:hypothetical protein
VTDKRSGYTRQLNSRYASYGQNVSFTNPADQKPTVMRMIDLTKGVEVGGEAQMATVLPSITARSADINALNLEPSELIGTVFTVSGTPWAVLSYAPHPSPWGLDYGEIYFVVEANNG